LSVRDQLALGIVGLRTRKARGMLSALGVGVGIAALVAVMGLAGASKADLMAQLAALGTNVLAATPGQTSLGDEAVLPASAPGMLARIGTVEQTAGTYLVDAHVYKNDHISAAKTSGLTVAGADLGLLDTVRCDLAAGRWLDGALASYPAVVLGSKAAERLAVTDLDPPVAAWIAGRWFGIVGILAPAALAPELNTMALIGTGIAAQLNGELQGLDPDETELAPTRVYLRVMEGLVTETRDLVARTANPAAPGEVEVTRPSDVLAAQAATDESLTALSLGLGAVGLAVGGIGIANVMVVAVMERTGEIGVRRALGARRRAIRRQFLVEAVTLAVIGGGMGAIGGTVAALGYEWMQGWPMAVPWRAVGLGLGACVVIGTLAGTWPALRAARVSPTEALRRAG
jgi:putative ABC transport system permease protein